MNSFYERIYGSMIGFSIGDAMGGPVEMMKPEAITAAYSQVRTLLPYDHIEIAPHGPFSKKAGAYTDDTRLMKLIAQAAIAARSVPSSGDLAKQISNAYHQAENQLEREFLDEYYHKFLYRSEKMAFGGRSTNAGIMGCVPFAVLNPCNPEAAARSAWDAMIFCEGAAREAGALAAAAIAAAFIPGSDIDRIYQEASQALRQIKQKSEGTLWYESGLYSYVGRRVEDRIETAIGIARSHGVFSDACRRELMNKITGDFQADGAETLAIAFAMLTLSAAGKQKQDAACSPASAALNQNRYDDPLQAVIYAVNFGRDNDSSAAFCGAINGAINGAAGWPADMIEQIERVNPGPSIKKLAEELANIVHQHSADLIKRVDYYRQLGIIDPGDAAVTMNSLKSLS